MLGWMRSDYKPDNLLTPEVLRERRIETPPPPREEYRGEEHGGRSGMTPEQVAAYKLEQNTRKLEQLLRDALVARTTAQVNEHRILRKSFATFDRDCSGSIDIGEFRKALEGLGLHIRGVGLPGRGGIDVEVVQALFDRVDTDGSGQIDYDEFSSYLLTPPDMYARVCSNLY